MSESNPSYAHADWDKLAETHRTASRIDKGDKRLRSGSSDPSRTKRQTDAAVNAANRGMLKDQVRIREYRDIVDGLIHNTITPEAASTTLSQIWEEDRALLSSGGFLDEKQINKILRELEDDGVISHEEATNLADYASKEKKLAKMEAPTMWEQTIDALKWKRPRPTIVPMADPQKNPDILVPNADKKDRSHIDQLLNNKDLKQRLLKKLYSWLITNGYKKDVHDIGEEAYQMMAENLLKYADKINFAEIEAIEGYLFKILRNETINYFRKNKIANKTLPIEEPEELDAAIASSKSESPDTLVERKKKEREAVARAYLKGEITNDEGLYFGHSTKSRPEVLKRMVEIIERKTNGEDYLLIAQNIAKNEPKIATNYHLALEALANPKPDDPPIRSKYTKKELDQMNEKQREIAKELEKMANLMAIYYIRGMKILQDELSEI